uniref:Histone H2B n=1 Tax=Rhizophora mucronata TaxID=61149 RepID=A0A2P2JHW0_RHIMU
MPVEVNPTKTQIFSVMLKYILNQTVMNCKEVCRYGKKWNSVNCYGHSNSCK